MNAVTMLVIAKSPRPGRVKTRLCPPCTPEDAAAIAAAALEDTLTTVAATPAAARVLVLDGPPGPWIPDGFTIVPQWGQGLAERLTHAFASISGPALLVGMDTPQIETHHLVSASETLMGDDCDAVLGRAFDGGWWSIGLRAPDTRVFTDIPMSTDQTGRLQEARLRTLGYRTAILDTMHDVDTFADAIEVARTIPASRFAHAVARVVATTRAIGRREASAS